MEQFQPTITIPLGGRTGAALLPWFTPVIYEIILPETPQETVLEYLGEHSANFLAGGHTHTQQLRRVGPGERRYVNPGSISLAYNWASAADGSKVDPRADYAILTSEGSITSITFRQVPYDVAELSAIMRATGRPHVEDYLKIYE